MKLWCAGGVMMLWGFAVAALAQAPAIGADASAYLGALTSAQPSYSVTAAYYYKNFLKDEHKSWERRLHLAADGRFERMMVGDTVTYFAHGDTLFHTVGPARDSVLGEVPRSTFRDVLISVKLRRHFWPEAAAAHSGWRRVPAQDNDAAGTQRYRRTTPAPSLRKRDIRKPTSDEATLTVDLWLDPDGTTVRGIEQRLTFRDSLESVERFDFSDWRYGSVDAAAEATLALPRRIVVVEDIRKRFGPRAPTLPIRLGEPMPVIRGFDLDSAAVTASRSNAVYLFSFTACHPCALVVDQMRAGGYRLKDGARLVYVNPIDRVGEVAEYIDGHYGRGAFEVVIPDRDTSRGLALSRFPTLVTVDAAGIVRDISEMYREDIVRDLME